MKRYLFLLSCILLAANVSAEITAYDLTGNYQVEPPQNNWHIVEIKLEGADLVWTNGAGVSWGLTYENGVLKSVPDSPYGENTLTIVTDPPGSDTIKSLIFRSGEYVRQNSPPDIMVQSPPCCTNFTAPASTNILISAQDREGNMDRVEFWKDDAMLFSDTTEPYELNVSNLGEGTHFYKIFAYDDAGAYATAIIPVYVNRQQRVDEFDAFWTKYGGRNNFSNDYSSIIERYLSAEDEMNDGDYHSMRNIVDGIFTDFPIGDAAWNTTTAEVSHLINTGNPTAYYGLRMMDEIAKIGTGTIDYAESKALKLSIVIADCSFGVRPLNPEFTQSENVNSQIDPRVVANDYELFRMSLGVFERYIWAITDGEMHLEYDFYHATECVEVHHNTGDPRVTGLKNYTAPINQLSVEIRDNSDMFWVCYPENRLPLPLFHELVVITGGMGGYGNAPVFIIDDAFLLYNFGIETLNEKTDIERQIYMPQWLSHEFYHHLYRRFPEFNLEETGHQWFDRSTWPADFVGNIEPDYYAESLNKRLRTAEPGIAERLRVGKYWEFENLEKVTAQHLVGHYDRFPIENDWHIADVTLENGTLTWSNAAGVSWPLSFEGTVLSAAGGPYNGQELMIELEEQSDGDVIVTGLIFQGSTYTKSFDSMLVINGGFEDNATAWTIGNNSEISTEDFKQGSNSLKLNSNPSNNSQTIAIEPNTDYELSLWVNASAMTANDIHFDTLDKFDQGQVPGGTCQFNIGIGDADTWTKFTGTFNSANETSVTIRTYGSDMQGVVYFDNIRLRKLLPQDPYIIWKTNYNVTDDMADDDNDGIRNLMEYALGGDPRVATSGESPTVSDNQFTYDFKFKRNEAAVTYTLEKSTDLINWTDHVVVTDTHGAVGQEATVQVVKTEMAAGKLFLRLRVEN